MSCGRSNSRGRCLSIECKTKICIFEKDSTDIAENRSFRVGQTRENVDTRPSTNIRHISLSSTGIQNKNFGKTLEEAHRIGYSTH